MSTSDLQARILQHLSSGPSSSSSIRRTFGGGRVRMFNAIQALLESGKVRRVGLGSASKLELADDIAPKAPISAPESVERNRIQLVEELLEIERVRSEMESRRLEILERLR